MTSKRELEVENKNLKRAVEAVRFDAKLLANDKTRARVEKTYTGERKYGVLGGISQAEETLRILDEFGA